MKDHVTALPGPSGYPSVRLPFAGLPSVGDDARAMLRRLARRRWTIIGLTALFSLIAAIVIFQLTPVYKATTHVMIEPRQSRVADVEEVLSGLSGERETIESELRVIASRALAEKVIARLGLANDPEFNPELQPRNALLSAIDPLPWLSRNGWFDPQAWFGAETWTEIRAWIGHELAGMLEGGDKAVIPEEERLEHERARIVDTFLDKLDVAAEGRSRVIAISFTSTGQDVSARVANTLAELYLVEQLEAKYEATRLATTWLNERVAELRQTVVESEQAV